MKECIAFQMKSPIKALKHIEKNSEELITHNKYDNYPSYIWSDGYRRILKCKKCDAIILLQSSDLHSIDGEDKYSQDYFPVSSLEEVYELNKKFNNLTMKKIFKKRWLSLKNSKCSWK